MYNCAHHELNSDLHWWWGRRQHERLSKRRESPRSTDHPSLRKRSGPMLEVSARHKLGTDQGYGGKLHSLFYISYSLVYRYALTCVVVGIISRKHVRCQPGILPTQRPYILREVSPRDIPLVVLLHAANIRLSIISPSKFHVVVYKIL